MARRARQRFEAERLAFIAESNDRWAVKEREIEAALAATRWLGPFVDEDGFPLIDGDWPEVRACTRCYRHNEEGLVEHAARRSHMGHDVDWWPILTCAFDWVEVDGVWVRSGCDCFCHRFEQVVALAAARGASR